MNSQQKRHTVVVHDEAAAMMYSHIRFLANVSVPAAQKLRIKLYDAFSSLETMPNRCPIYKTRKTFNTYRRLVIGRYQIVFSVEDEKCDVVIRYILDSRQEHDI